MATRPLQTPPQAPEAFAFRRQDAANGTHSNREECNILTNKEKVQHYAKQFLTKECESDA
ncbi:hypothetical protein YC2023_031274 [Brassica napus]